MRHLSDSQIDALRRRALTPAELLALDDHLVGCVECRSRLSTPQQAGAGVDAPHLSLQEAGRQPMAAGSGWSIPRISFIRTDRPHPACRRR